MSAPPLPPPAGSGRAGGKIRVGFASRFLRDHTIGRLNRGLIDQLDRGRFEAVVLTVGDAGDDTARFLRTRADRFVVLPQALPAARQLVAEQQLDVLLYTDLGMDPITYSLAHSRLAPVQCATWGHPVTSGLKSIEYFISSELLEAPASEAQYTEQLVKLPHLAVYYQRPTFKEPRSRGHFGLPEDVTLYGCLQMLWKFHPEFDPLLGEILRRDRHGLLVITCGLSPFWDDKLMARFRRTIPDVADRIRFVPRQGYDDFLALTSLCDVMLDPTHFGGGNTTYEALAFGVPTVTLPSQFLRGRITKALYDTIGVQDCVAGSAEDYVEIASSLGLDRDRRAGLREKLLASNNALFDNPAGVRDLEAFFERAGASL